MTEDQPKPDPRKSAAKAERERRLGEALRENLRRRKEAVAGWKEDGAGAGKDEAGGGKS